MSSGPAVGRRRGPLPAAALLLLAAAAAAPAGCWRSRALTDAQAGVPDASPEARQVREQAVLAGAEALADFRREQFRAELAGRAPDFAAPRRRLAGALERLASQDRAGIPAPGVTAARAALCNALAAMDEIIAARGRADAPGVERGWVRFDAAVEELAAALAAARQ